VSASVGTWQWRTGARVSSPTGTRGSVHKSLFQLQFQLRTLYPELSFLRGFRLHLSITPHQTSVLHGYWELGWSRRPRDLESAGQETRRAHFIETFAWKNARPSDADLMPVSLDLTSK